MKYAQASLAKFSIGSRTIAGYLNSLGRSNCSLKIARALIVGTNANKLK